MIQIRPISDLRNNFTAIESLVKSGVVYLTKNGYGKMVVMSIEAYSELTDDVELSLDVADRHSESSSEMLSHGDVFSELRKITDGSLICYISGPISDCPDYKGRFADAEALLRDKGCAVVNPAAEIEVVEGKAWEEYMAEAVDLMGQCNCIYMLPGWEKSRGARIEIAIARRRGFKIFLPL